MIVNDIASKIDSANQPSSTAEPSRRAFLRVGADMSH